MVATIDREWCLLFVDNGGLVWNPGNPLVGQIPDQIRDSITELASRFYGTSEDVELSVWEEFTMNGRWLNPAESIINCLALTYIGIRFPHLLASIEGVLRDCRLPANSLTCLDGEDVSRLTKRLVECATSAIINGNDKREALRLGLIEWLQEWSGSGSEDLGELVRETRLMRGVSPYLEEEVDWVKDGF